MKNSTKTNVSLSNDLLNARKSNQDDYGTIAHRLELVSTVKGVDYINDSKATDVNSTWYSIEAMPAAVIWIVGISDTETDYAVFKDLVSEKVKAIVCLGKNKEGALDSLIPEVDCFVEATSIEDAVIKAKSLSFDGNVVLFSPACSSFHLFQNYQDRGNEFRKVVKSL